MNLSGTPSHAEVRSFVERSTFLFMVSRGADGRYNLSPRGDVPSVLTFQPDGSVLMPDRAGNNRIETLRNVLRRPELRLALVVVGEERFLLLEGQAEISRDSKLLDVFAVRGEPPATVMRIQLRSACFVGSAAFADGELWTPLERAMSPLPLKALIESQIAFHGGQHVASDVETQATLAMLELHGLKGTYPPLEQYVRGKAFPVFDHYSCDFLRTTRLAMLGFEGGVMLLGGAPGFAQAVDERHLRLRTRFEPLVAVPERGASLGGLLGCPGRNEALRLNGTLVSSVAEGDVRVTTVRTSEIYFHCSNAIARARIWRTKSSLAWAGTRRFVCRERIEECEGVVSLLLTPDDDDRLPEFRPGQYVTVSAAGEDSCPAAPRCYSLSNAPGCDHFRITVRRIDNGAMSGWLHDAIRPGSRQLRLGAPRGRFVLDEASERIPTLIGAGVGLTPLVSMLSHLTHTAPGRRVWFIHGARSGGEHAMRDPVRATVRVNPGLRTCFAYSQPRPEDVFGRDYDHAGRVDIGLLERHVDLLAADYYLCGPAAFMTSLTRDLELRGVPPGRIKRELFGAGPTDLAARATVARVNGRLPVVKFTRSGRELAWNDAAGSLLGLALGCGLDAPYICRQGDCQTCALRLARGDVTYPGELEVLPPEGYVLMCQATPAGDVEIEL